MFQSIPQQADIVVVGAGVMGTSIAYHLAKLGAGKVVLLEKKNPANGPSGKSHAIMPQYYTIETLAKMASESWNFYRNFDSILDRSPAVYHKVGFALAYQEALADEWEKNVARQKRFSFSPRIIDAKELREICPQFFLSEFFGACYDKDGGYVDSQLVVKGFVDAAVDMNAQVLQNVSVKNFEIRQGEVSSVVTDLGSIRTDAVVCSTGIWTGSLLENIGIATPIINTKVGICMFRRPADFQGDHLCFADFVNSCYLRAQGSTLTDLAIFESYGSSNFNFELKSEVDPDNYIENMSDTQLEQYVKVASKYPSLRNASIHATYSCVYDNTPDRQPLLGELPTVRKFFLAAGFSGAGFKLAPSIGKAMSEIVLKSGKSETDVTILRPTRFQEGKPIKCNPVFDCA